MMVIADEADVYGKGNRTEARNDRRSRRSDRSFRVATGSEAFYRTLTCQSGTDAIFPNVRFPTNSIYSDDRLAMLEADGQYIITKQVSGVAFCTTASDVGPG